MSRGRIQAEVRQLLERGLDELALSVSPTQLEQLEHFTSLLARWAERIRLTGHRDPEAITKRLVLDAAALSEALPSFTDLVDLGSGAGFPGIPIAILRPTRRVRLVEAREKPHYFQRAVSRELGLTNMSIQRGRFEEMAPTLHQAVVAQAVAPAAKVIKWMVRWASPGAWLILPGGSSPPKPGLLPEIRDVQIRRYSVPLHGPTRTLWLGRVAVLPSDQRVRAGRSDGGSDDDSVGRRSIACVT